MPRGRLPGSGPFRRGRGDLVLPAPVPAAPLWNTRPRWPSLGWGTDADQGEQAERPPLGAGLSTLGRPPLGPLGARRCTRRVRRAAPGAPRAGRPLSRPSSAGPGLPGGAARSRPRGEVAAAAA